MKHSTLSSSPNSGNTHVSGRPVRIQRSRQSKQVSPNGLEIVYTGRPSKYGNPFKVGHFYQMGDRRIGIKSPLPGGQFVYLEALNEKYADSSYEVPKTNAECVELYKRYLKISGEMTIERMKKDLAGKNLSCWCKIGEPCHADVLLEIMNR